MMFYEGMSEDEAQYYAYLLGEPYVSPKTQIAALQERVTYLEQLFQRLGREGEAARARLGGTVPASSVLRIVDLAFGRER